MGRKVIYAVFLAAALMPAICGRAYGGDRQLIQLPAYYYPIDLLGEKKRQTSEADSRRCAAGLQEIRCIPYQQDGGELFHPTDSSHRSGLLVPGLSAQEIR